MSVRKLPPTGTTLIQSIICTGLLFIFFWLVDVWIVHGALLFGGWFMHWLWVEHDLREYNERQDIKKMRRDAKAVRPPPIT